MRLPSVTVAVLAFTLFLTVRADGQACAGLASFINAPYQVSGVAEYTKHAHDFGGALTLGGPATFFGVALGTTHYDASKGSSFDVSGGGGYELALGQRGMQLCPVVAAGHRSGPDNYAGSALNYSETDVGAALRLGGVASESEHVRLIPTVGLGLEFAQQTFSDFSGTSTSRTHGFGVLQFGLGFLPGKTMTLLSEATVPIGLANSSATFGITVAANFAL
ncbi:MAG TPA: hypothetical protein VM716_09545 [Gemmatimonadales bacterium]|nr:hypothetical protein [Gemmatimonadales bacterium]